MNKILGTILALAVGVGILWGFDWLMSNGHKSLETSLSPATRIEQRDAAEKSSAEQQSAVHDIETMRQEYDTASSARQNQLGVLIKQRVNEVPPEALTPEIKDFLRTLP